MTQSVNSPEGTLDLSVDSTRIRARKGETLVWNQNFTRTADGASIDVSGWTFTGFVRNGINPATQNPIVVNLDVKKFTSGSQNQNVIQLFINTLDLTNLNPPTGRSSMTTYEVEATIPTGLTDSNGDAIMKQQIVQVGQIELFADIHDSSAP